MADQTPFIVYDADVYLYRVDANGEPVEQVYLGGCSESISMEQTLSPRRLEYHGRVYARERHDDEEHMVELKNVWLNDRSQVHARMPAGHGRNLVYALVIIWKDEDAGAWTKRTYRSATCRGQRIEESTYQVLRFRAESLVESAGDLASGDPAIAPGQSGTVRYLNGEESVDLYTYDADTHILTALDEALLAGRAEILVDDASLEILFAGVPALFANTAATSIVHLVATGSTFLDSTPRLEFYLGTARVASLGADGTLVVINLAEQGNPALVDFEFLSGAGDWLFSLMAPGSFFPEIREVAEV